MYIGPPCTLPITDIAVTKCHQWMDKIWIISIHTSTGKSDKLPSRKFCHVIYALTLNAVKFAQHTLVRLLYMHMFHTAYACYVNMCMLLIEFPHEF